MVVEHPVEGRILGIRPSMKKFECSTSNQLEIVKSSAPTKLYLNKHLITILEQMGVPKEVFLELEVDMIFHLLDSLIDEEKAADLLTQNLCLAFPFKDLQRAGVSLTSDPFFRSLLLAYFKSFADNLKSSMRVAVPVSYGRNMLGVLDETKTLKYGQVFVQYSKSLTDPSTGCKILKGDVLVTKNPSLHPGDVRKLIAVDVPKLHHIKDCIVFPARGSRPHPDEMAGSDLDGDEMAVIWYKPLIFSCKNAKPMNYPVYTEKSTENKIIVSDMVDFFCKYIKNDNIGTFAHAHLVWADKLPDGIFSQKCLNIAKQYPYVLDFAKHGTLSYLKKSDRPGEYPDFLEKGLTGNTYHSPNVLGSLFRTSRVLVACSSKINLECEASSFDPDLEYPGWKAYEKSAEVHRTVYTAKILEVLTRYRLCSEAEAFSGYVELGMYKKWREEKNNAIKIIRKYLNNIMFTYRNIFYSEIEVECENNKYNAKEKLECKFKRASAWYMVVYGNKSNKVLSFPWVVSEILLQIKINSNKNELLHPYTSKNNFFSDIDNDVKQWHTFNRVDPEENTCFCITVLKKITLEWFSNSGLNIGRSNEGGSCDSCYNRIFDFYQNKKSNMHCCSASSSETCSCDEFCSPAKLLTCFLSFYIKGVESSLGCCSTESCDGFLPKNLQELSLQTFSFLTVTRNIFYLGLHFNTNNIIRNSIPSNVNDSVFEEEEDHIKIPANSVLRDLVENYSQDIETYLRKKSGVKSITLQPERQHMCLIISSVGKTWQRWNLQEILLDMNFTENLRRNLNIVQQN